MEQPDACPRCKASRMIRAHLESAGGGTPRVVVDEGHASPMAARVCVACGHVELVALQPRSLKPGEGEGAVQEYDF